MAKVFHSFAELGAAMGFRMKPKHEPPVRKCFRCGSDMPLVEGTNVCICHGQNDKGEPCGNRLILAVT